ncbi:RagB/SusD family nutrient uptake outer membrane protein [Phocaeicola dorei]|uniref:RagB/SusD family nutrient uptake outer membrane protein n=1 Tax=Phocaeicola dorei TaxID=357276 RepID=UPI001C390BA1|nr:RagB/SusD family nutrient uptake outer membrane protein [Phocaeicola dorei]MBV4238642.1 RagB/SusD family nutrient uptake outer membrane protein [Phocaeicola dorei]MCB6461219.1 RagB/SusD family nutrient uptake outer membrane protein [Phocaeicola dorei]MCB6746588.1 RagB/SusD family nutrient uptake outer membrane protein [Phocaeicola dorei]MCB6772002.1 RagB/SusD family nutrient uptake outer membrane protein [Phocaeicola dorei]MCB6790788.1 RagB/SusD family nutrient uptake outer membrane protein
MKKKYLLICPFLFLLAGCYDLDKLPQGELSSATAFGTTAEINLYLNQFYQGSVYVAGSTTTTVSNTAIRGQSTNVGNASGIAFTDLNSDNMLGNVIDTRLAGETALSNASQLNDYKLIRNVNFLIKNLGNCKEEGKDLDQCIGEAYYFRAAFYYHLLVNYGGVTWMEDLLDPDAGQMQLPRNTRTEIADHILADLDVAIEHLNSQTTNATMRVHKDVARALKSEVALFAGTWEKYHRQKGTDFYDKSLTNADEKVRSYLQQAADAAKDVMETGTWQITKGNPATVYRDLFITLDLSSNNEVLWWKKYDAASNIGHSVTRFLNMGGGQCGASASLVDDYLTAEGKPFVGNARNEAKKVYGKEFEGRDPRLTQTICAPGQELRPDGAYTFTLPPLNGNSYHQNTTGYSILKYVEFNTTYEPTIDGEGKSQAPAIQVRYADVLLNYAEALAELDGAANESRIKEALKPLRERVGMPEVDFDREYNTESDYPFRGLDKYIQAVRRERRVEKAIEGCRLNDILRWAAADVLIKGITPKGALFTGSDLENNEFYYDANGNYELIYDQTSGNNLYLTGAPSDTERYIVPFNNASYPDGWQFNLGRDYLLPIQERMLSLTGYQWEQNPGW